MSQTLNIRHVTRYNYDDAPAYGLQQLRLSPLDGPSQRVIDWDVSVEGGTVQSVSTDEHGNRVHLVRLGSDGDSLIVTSAGMVEVGDVNGVIGPHTDVAPLWLYLRNTPLTEASLGLSKLLEDLQDGDAPSRLHNLSRRIRDRVAYTVGATTAETTADGALQLGQGVCQDHSHIFIAAARALGHPARYVSGYLSMDDRVDQDATHAWAEAHVDGLGWVGFDISNGHSPDTRYVRIATALDYAGAAPISGSLRGGTNEQIAVELRVAQGVSQSIQQ